MKETIILLGFMFVFLWVVFASANVVIGWNDRDCKTQYGSEWKGRLGYHGSPECVGPNGDAKYLTD